MAMLKTMMRTISTRRMTRARSCKITLFQLRLQVSLIVCVGVGRRRFRGYMAVFTWLLRVWGVVCMCVSASLACLWPVVIRVCVHFSLYCVYVSHLLPVICNDV